MDLVKLREELEIDEGVEYEIYKDHLGYPTFGVGHLILESDPEHGEEMGTPVSKERVIEAFESDVKIVVEDCKVLYPDFDDLPEECQHIIANMMFNLGRPRLSKFEMMKAAVDARDFNAAAAQMVDSKWYTQVPNRARRLVDRMRALAETS